MRRDIQFLRGIAVLVVVLYHSNLGFLNQGYLGVDIFFVLSGFLITSIILKGLNNNFIFSVFYLRRANRLLPALYCTLLFTTLLSVIMLTNKQWLEYLEQLKGALTFTANMVLPGQSGYFESASEGKPLLHIWSLSLEEQYYFLLPVLLYLLPKNYRLIGIILLMLASAHWCFSWVYSTNQSTPFLWRIADSSKSEWAFFLLPTRAWELLGGSLCAWIMLNKPLIALPKTLKVIALAALFLTCIMNINNEHPSLESVIIVLSTMIILIGNNDWLPRYRVVRSIESIGDWSYSIYLVHWPLFAFAYLGYVGDVPTTTKIFLAILSILLGFLQYKYVETPFREGRFKNLFSSWKAVITSTLILFTIPIISAYTTSNIEDEFSHIRRVNHGMAKECEGSFDDKANLKSACAAEGKPKIVIWGDSYAMHLVPGLVIQNAGVVQITKSVCGPILGLAPINGEYDTVWAKKCLAFTDNALNYIKNNHSITHVILSANFSNYLNFNDSEYLTRQGVVTGSYQLFVNSFKDTILALKALNITPVVFSPLPKSGFDVGECLERMHSPVLLLRTNCDIKYSETQKYQHLVNESLKDIEKESKVIWLKDYLCKEGSCNGIIDGTFIYRDNGHLSVDGSVKLLRNINIIRDVL